jgi:hypothetical protein
VQRTVNATVAGSSPALGAWRFPTSHRVRCGGPLLKADLLREASLTAIYILRWFNRKNAWLLTRSWGFDPSLKGSTYGSQEARRQVATLKTQVRILSVRPSHAVMAQRLAHNLAKVGVAGSNPAYRSTWVWRSGNASSFQVEVLGSNPGTHSMLGTG